MTGGAGFIGSHTSEALLKKGCEVTILDNLTEPTHRENRPLFLPKRAHFIRGDVRNRQDWEKALEGVTAVIHLAAYQDYLPDFSKFFHVNTVGTALLYEIAVEKKLPLEKIVVASSQAVYGEGKYACAEHGTHFPDIRSDEQLAGGSWEIQCPICGQPSQPQWTDEERVNPQNQYALSKYGQEQTALKLGKRYGLPTVALRYSIVQGARQSFFNTYSGAMRIFCLNLFFGKIPPVYEDGLQLRDYVNIADIVAANLAVLDRDEANDRVFNVGSGKSFTVKEFYDKVAAAFSIKEEPHLPGEYRYGDTRHIISDISKLKSLGWTPRISLEQSIQEYKSYLEDQADMDDILDFQKQRMKDLNVVRKRKA